jgi:flagellar P-ring protein FlgI
MVTELSQKLKLLDFWQDYSQNFGLFSKMKYYLLHIYILAVIFTCFANQAYATRLKDIADIEGVRGNQLLGYGVVVGLNGTGDGNKIDFTVKSLSNLLENMGIRVNPQDLKVKNVAAVLVTAELPPFSRPGTKIDVTLSSLGDAKSLLGGTLLFTPLRGADGNVYAVAQGAISVGGFSIAGEGDSAQKNHPTVGTISQGAIVERHIPFDLFQSEHLRVVLRQPDFTTMTRVITKINSELGIGMARALDSASLEVPLAKDKELISFVSRLEQIEVEEDIDARVVVNERSGTVVIGDNVRISKIALAHGNLSIAIRSDTQISQPNALSPQGETQAVTNTDVDVAEDVKRLSVLGGEVTLADVVEALNSLGATPRDLISIFLALKKSGALHAELIIM